MIHIVITKKLYTLSQHAFEHENSEPNVNIKKLSTQIFQKFLKLSF